MKTMTGEQPGEKLLRSVRQMQRGESVRTTRVKPNAAAKARADTGLSQIRESALGIKAKGRPACLSERYGCFGNVISIDRRPRRLRRVPGTLIDLAIVRSVYASASADA